MEFKDKLIKLRNDNHLTQEQLAEKLFLSRVTISKWETGRGYPNLDSLKLMSKIFNTSIDDLLSGEQLIEIATDNSKNQITTLCTLLFGLVDFSICIFFVLPIFVDRTIKDSVVLSSLLGLNFSSNFVRIIMFSLIIVTCIYGIIELALQNLKNIFWNKTKFWISFGISLTNLVLFILTMQQNPALVSILFLIIKIFIYLKVTKSITNVKGC